MVRFSGGARGVLQKYSLYAFINVDNFERPHVIIFYNLQYLDAFDNCKKKPDKINH